MIARLGLLLALLPACAGPTPPEPGLAPEPIPADGSLPPGVEAMLFGGSRGCRDDLDCESQACEFGTCVGLVTADEPWRVMKIGARVRERIRIQPELAPLLTSFLAVVAGREEMGLAFRGRAVTALGELHAPGETPPPDDPVSKELRSFLVTAPSSVAEVAALGLARIGDATGVDLVVALAESERLAVACEAMRALGRARDPEVLPTLLAALSPDVDLELQRAAIDGLAALGDKRAIRPLVSYLATGPDALADTIAAVLRKMTGAAYGPDALRWDAWVAANPPPAPPAYEPRGHDSSDDIDLPTP